MKRIWYFSSHWNINAIMNKTTGTVYNCKANFTNTQHRKQSLRNNNLLREDNFAKQEFHKK